MARSPAAPDASGRFLLRIDAGLHAALRRAATAQGLSLNDYCARALASAAGVAGAWHGGAEAVTRAAALVGAELVGVATFGSWARGEAAPDSDIDLLIVVDGGLKITRSLYRRWDEVPLTWDGRAIEPHFVHLPGRSHDGTGLWAEVAMDGIVLFARDLALPRCLGAIRHAIAEGRIVRRLIHGQPYWKTAA